MKIHFDVRHRYVIGNDKFNNYFTCLKTISACSALIAFTYDIGGSETILFYWTMEMPS